MYKSLTAEEIRRLLQLPENYKIDGLLVSGTNPKAEEYPHLFEALEKLAMPYREQNLQSGFFSDVKILMIGDKRIWFDVVYGTAYLGEVIHVASMLGSKANILLGSCGALLESLDTGDTIIPHASYGNESSTRMYQRKNKTYIYESDARLNSELKKHLATRKTVNEGTLVTVQAMMAETKEDVDEWVMKGYAGVDMESATVFAVSNHFKVPSAALLYVADNLVKNQLVTDPSYESLRAQRTAIRKENYEAALKVLMLY
jgi:purine-nucleoside phosphorylase